MKKVALLVLSLAALGGLASPASAGSFSTGANGSVVFVGSISSSVTDVLNRDRNNPQALQRDIKDLLERQPSLADDVIEAANTQTNATTAIAIANGYGDAVSALNGSNSQAAGTLRTQSVYFNSTLQAVYSAAATAAPAKTTPPGGGKTGGTIIVPPSTSPK